MDEGELIRALEAWGLGDGWVMRQPPRGMSRLTRFVDSPAGSFVVSGYPAGTTEERVRYEHALLSALGTAGLPFEVPRPMRMPIKGELGETVMRVRSGEEERMVALFTVVPGEDLDRTNERQTRAFGAALGQVHQAMVTADVGQAPAWGGIYGAMERVLAGDREMVDAVGAAPVAGGELRSLIGMLEQLMADGPAVTGRLPGQMRHGDWHRGNVLAVGERISGVLDFEVAGPGPRAMDLAHGVYYLWAWCEPEEEAWKDIHAFAEGYRSVVIPTEAEVAAVPLLARLYFAASIPPLVARWRDGTASAERVRSRVEQLLRLDGFFRRDERRIRAALSGGV